MMGSPSIGDLGRFPSRSFFHVGRQLTALILFSTVSRRRNRFWKQKPTSRARISHSRRSHARSDRGRTGCSPTQTLRSRFPHTHTISRSLKTCPASPLITTPPASRSTGPNLINIPVTRPSRRHHSRHLLSLELTSREGR